MVSFKQLRTPSKDLLDESIGFEHLVSDFSNNLLPVGAVIAVMDNIPGSYTHPGGGAVDRGLMLCDGAAIVVGAMNGQNTPNINSDVFLRGSTVSGSVGGANDQAIPVAALPPHTHSVSVTANGAHGHAASPNGTAIAPHDHDQYSTTANPGPGVRRDYNNVNGPYYSNPQGPLYAANMPHNTPAGVTGAANAPHGHPVTVDAAGTGSPFNIEPSYVTTKYAIRVI